jgi:hypothetical protein
VGSSRDRSTAVVGGNSPIPPRLLGIIELTELPQGLFGSARAGALAAVDHRYNNNALIVADLSYDRSYVEQLHETFGPRVIGLHISRSSDGMTFERQLVGAGIVLVYTIGRSYLLERFHGELHSGQVRFVPGKEAERAYAQLEALETELRETGTVYKCLPGKHDDLGISCAMLAWAAGHPHLPHWINTGLAWRRPRPQRQKFGWGAFT